MNVVRVHESDVMQKSNIRRFVGVVPMTIWVCVYSEVLRLILSGSSTGHLESRF